MNIKIATIEDIATITNFNKKLCVKENKEFDSTINSDFSTTELGIKYFTKNIKSEDGLVLIALENETPIGYLVAEINEVNDYRNIEKISELDNMWVDDEYRSTGVGKELIKLYENWSRDKGVLRTRVIASSKNNRAIDFYKREGFQEYDLILEKDL